MSNRTKIKKKAPKPQKSAASDTLVQGRQYWQPPQALLAAVIFVALGVAILAKSLYMYAPAGVILLGLLIYSGFCAGSYRRGMRFILTPVILVSMLIIVKVYITLNR